MNVHKMPVSITEPVIAWTVVKSEGELASPLLGEAPGSIMRNVVVLSLPQFSTGIYMEVESIQELVTLVFSTSCLPEVTTTTAEQSICGEMRRTGLGRNKPA
jgi:hypothetical protein